jgi:hypothetical protein
MIAAIYAHKSTERKGDSLMPKLIGVLIFGLVLAAPNLGEAACAWVLWQELTIAASGGISSSWEIMESTESKDACAPRAALATKVRADYMKSSNASAPRPDPDQTVEIKGDSVRVSMARAGQLWVYRFLCLPDTIDPRGPKGGAR